MSRKKRQEKENSERWLLTYSDLITLLVALFILLYSMSTVNEEKYQQLSDSLGSSLGKRSTILDGSGSIIDKGTNISSNNSQGTGTETGENTSEDTTEGEDTTDQGEVTGITEVEDMEDLKENVDNMLSQYNVSGEIVSTIGQSGLVITFSNNAFFDSGDANLHSNMKKSLKLLAVLLNRIDNAILIEGNADNVPVNNSDFSSNWQLSAARAANVAQYLVDVGKIKGDRLSAIGYGEYNPVASNDTAEGRKQNRRIDITILYDKKSSIHE